MRQNLQRGGFRRGAVKSDVTRVPLDSVNLGSPQSTGPGNLSVCGPGVLWGKGGAISEPLFPHVNLMDSLPD